MRVLKQLAWTQDRDRAGQVRGTTRGQDGAWNLGQTGGTPRKPGSDGGTPLKAAGGEGGNPQTAGSDVDGTTLKANSDVDETPLKTSGSEDH